MSHRYYISDHHFGHENIFKFERKARPFESNKDHCEWLVAQHNSRCTKRDLIVFGGDVGVGKDAAMAMREYLPQMNGQFELILGNHDEMNMDFYQRFFKRISMNRVKTVGDNKVWISHVPVHPSELDYRCDINLHGHLHSETIEDDRRYVNFCVEHCNGVPQTIQEWLSGERAVPASAVA